MTVGWALGAMGLGDESPDYTEQIGLIIEELTEIIDLLTDISQELEAIENVLKDIRCDDWREALTTATGRIDTLLTEYNSYVSAANKGSKVSDSILSDWVDTVMILTADGLGMKDILSTMANDLLGQGSGIIPACMATLTVPADNTLDDTYYYDQVASLTGYYYYYQTLGLWFLTEAQHYQAWVAAGSPTSDTLPADLVPQVCDDENAEFDCIAAATWTNTVYNSLVDQFTAAGAPYTNDDFLMQNDASEPRLWVKSLEDFTAAAGDDCPYPLTSASPCGITVGLYNDANNLSGITYYTTTRRYTDFNYANADHMLTLFNGWQSATAGNFLMSNYGFQNMNHKILLTTGPAVTIKLDARSGTAAMELDAVPFIDTNFNYNEQPGVVYNNNGFNNITQNDVAKNNCSEYGIKYTKHKNHWHIADWLSDWDRNGFYDIAAWSGGCDDSKAKWNDKPGWNAEVTDSKAKQYRWPLGQKTLFTDYCTEGRSPQNAGGVWSMCGNDFADWFDNIVPRPPTCDDPDISPVCSGLPDPHTLLDYNADSDTDGNNYWENQQTDITGYNWYVGDPTVVRVTDVSSLPGISAAYQFDGSAPAHLTSYFQDLPGDPTNDSASFEVWFKPSDLSGDEIIFEISGESAGISLALSGSTLLATWGSNGVNLQLTHELSSTEEFIQAMAVIELLDAGAATLSLYVDGELVAQDFPQGLLAWAADHHLTAVGGWTGEIGGNNINTLSHFGHFVGQIAIVRIYDRARSAQDVEQLYAHIAE
jgi:hypothetical protein